jgi:phospholipid transport system substrate-binding protein
MPYPGRPGYGPYGRRAAPEASGPGAEFKRGMQRMLSFLKRSPGPGREQLAAFAASELAPYFDFAYMARSAAGPRYRGLDAEGRARLTERLKRSFLGTMVDKLAGYSGQGMQFIGTRTNPDGRTATITVAIMNPGNYPARLTFRMYRGKQGWKVYDVAANGQSAVAHYRRQFSQSMPGARRPRLMPGYR